MTEDDLIARAMTGAMRQLLAASLVHQAAGDEMQDELLSNAKAALDREIATIGMEAVGSDGERLDLSDALQASLHILVDAALSDAHTRLRLEGSRHFN